MFNFDMLLLMKRNFSMNKHTFSILILSLFLSPNAKAAI